MTWLGVREHERVLKTVEGWTYKFFFSAVVFEQQLEFELVKGVLGNKGRRLNRLPFGVTLAMRGSQHSRAVGELFGGSLQGRCEARKFGAEL